MNIGIEFQNFCFHGFTDGFEYFLTMMICKVGPGAGITEQFYKICFKI